MENKFVQYIESIKHALDEDIPDIDFISDLDSMSNEEIKKHVEKLEKYVKDNCLHKKGQLKHIFSLMIFAIQQLYFDSFKKEELKVDFQILEGKVSLVVTTVIFTFIPDPSLEKLFAESERTNTARLKEVMGSRFYKLVEALYRVEK